MKNLPIILLILICLEATILVHAQAPDAERFLERSRAFSQRIEANGLSQDFIGITTDGTPMSGLFPIESTGISTEAIWQAANHFIETLSPQQRETTLYPIDSQEWRKWANQHIYYREGISFEAMNEEQRVAALDMLGESLSVKGLSLTRDIMRLNQTLGELNGNNFIEYGEGRYWLTLMGTPSATEPWGWQLDGHHLNLNYFVMGDQVVMTPAFWGSEPAVAESGQYAGTRIMDAEQTQGLTVIRSLDGAQQDQAIIQVNKTGNNIMTQAFSDNVVLDYAGISVSGFRPAQKAELMELIALYIGNMRNPHAELRMAEISDHLDDTYFAWIGGTQDDSVFYYRIQSPVLLIEFDHETPVGLSHLYPRGVPYREHIHSIVRTPNGNDYGRDLLRQHYLSHPH